jgi:hypothetical protein
VILLTTRSSDRCLKIAGATLFLVLSPTFTIIQSRSEVDDINLGLEHFYGDFNVVHAQLISSGVSSLVFSSFSVIQITYLCILDQRLRNAN